MYTMYLDETGTDDITNTHDDNNRFFSLSGAIMRKEVANGEATEHLNQIKKDFFGTENIVFHRKKIMTRHGEFQILKDEEKDKLFRARLEDYITKTKFRLATVVMDKRAMLRKDYWTEKDPYHYCMGIIVEKYTQWLERQGNKTGDMIFESRNPIKDAALGEKYKRIYKHGYGHNSYISVDRIQKAITCNELRFAKKAENITGLQLVDLIANPSWKYVMSTKNNGVKITGMTEKIIGSLVGEKYDRNANGWMYGYGVKYLP